MRVPKYRPVSPSIRYAIPSAMCGNTKSLTHTQCFDAGTASVATCGPRSLYDGRSARAEPPSNAHDIRALTKWTGFIRKRIVRYPTAGQGLPAISDEFDIAKTTTLSTTRRPGGLALRSR